MHLKQLFLIIIKIANSSTSAYAVECEHVNLDGVSGPGTCVTAWTSDPISGDKYTKRFCDPGKPSTPTEDSECNKQNPFGTCFCNTTCCNGNFTSKLQWDSSVCSGPEAGLGQDDIFIVQERNGSDGLLKISMFAMLLALGINLFFPSKIQ